jgi:hypothetical protein
MVATPNPGIAGKPILLTAKVSAVAGSAVFTGTVMFTDGTTPIGSMKLAPDGTVAMGVTLAPGAHALEAAYEGDANNMPSASSALPFAVNLASTVVSLKTSASPALALSPTTFTATVHGNGGMPTGSVTFIVDGASAASTPLDAMGTAAYSNSSLTVGTRILTASYSGDGNNDLSTSAPLAQIVQAIPTTTNLRGSSTTGSNPQLTLVATTVAITGIVPTGSVTFWNESNAIGSAALDAGGVGTLTVTLPQGTYTIIATYIGDAFHAPSSSAPVSLSTTAADFDLSVDPLKITMAASQHTSATIRIRSNHGYSDTIGLGCGGLPALVACHFSQSDVALAGDATKSVQLTIDTNNPLGGGQSALNLLPRDRAFSLAGLVVPASLLFPWIFRRFRKKHYLSFSAALGILLTGALLITSCGSYTVRAAAPGTYMIQVFGAGTTTNINHVQIVTLVITKTL